MKKIWKGIVMLLCVCCMTACFAFASSADVVIKSNMVDNCEPYEVDHVTVIRASEQQSFQMGGMTYTDALEFKMGYHVGYTSSATFNLFGAYESVSFEAGHIKGGNGSNASFKVEVDDVEVDTATLEPTDLPRVVNLSLKGARKMTITMRCGNYTTAYFGVGNIQFVSNGKVRDVVLKQNSLELNEENPSASLTAVVVPKDAKNQAVTWKSSNPSVVTVDAYGNVKAVSAGEADITVTTKEGGIEATCHVVSDLPKRLTNEMVKLSNTVFTYAGAEIKPEVTVSYQGKNLTQGKDFSVTYSGNKEEGTGTVTVTGIGEYVGTVTKNFTITHTHKYARTIQKATTKKNGAITQKCSICGHVGTKTEIPYAKTMKLSATSYTYNGKARKPSVTILDAKGKKLSKSNYTVTYAKGRKNIGTYKVTVKLKGNYSGTLSKTFKIVPKSARITSLRGTKRGFTIKWKKQQSKFATGYQIQYSTNRSFRGGKILKVKGSTKVSVKKTKLKAAKKYYVRIRTYKTVSGKTYYSSWSAIKSVKTKR